MSEPARDRILGSLRKTLAVAGDDAKRRSEAEARIAAHARGTVPARATVEHGAAMVAFVARLKSAGVTVAETAHMSDVPGQVADYLRGHNLPARIRHGADPELAALSWAETAVEVAHGPAAATDAVSLSRAFAGVAESGTIVLTSGADNPTTLNFLPETQIIVVQAASVVGGYEDAWDRLRAAFPRGLPRTVNWVSGPSRTADIEQTIVMGAHGPRRLHVIVSG